MSHPFQHPRGKGLLKRVSDAFRLRHAYILRDSNIIFVCGGPMNGLSMRARFSVYAKTQLPHLRVFLAEDAEKDYVTHDEPEFHNVGEFEELIGDVSDCLVIFPESPGSFAELGYFANNKEIRKKILVANDAKLQSDDSFILRGPIQQIDAHSNFKPAIQLDYGPTANFDFIKQRLEKRIVGKNRRKLEHIEYAQLTFRVKFFIIFELVWLFRVITLDAIEFAFKSLFRHASLRDIKHQLSILVAAKLISRVGDNNQFFCINRESKPFMEFDGFDEGSFALEILDLYNKDFPDLSAFAGGIR